MEVRIFKTLWGHQGTFAEAAGQVVEAGFDGIEGPAPKTAKERKVLDGLLKSHDLEFIAEVVTGGGYVPDPAISPECHLEDLRLGIERSLPLAPLFVNTLAGLDAWDWMTQVAFFEKVAALEDEYEILISVETHRSRPTFNPWATRALLNAVPGLKITCDFSHWCCVAERLVMDDDPELLEFFASRCHHIHARVGYDQGPQVPDPRAPEYAHAVARHRAWWAQLLDQRTGGCPATMTPEFGPDGYLHREPFTEKPVADLWEVNAWMGGQLRDWFEKD